MITYIIEDDPLKSDRLRLFLFENFPQLEIHTYASFNSALRAVESIVPAVIILDMTLPTFDRSPASREGRLRPLGGYDLMRKLRRSALEPKIIIVTQLEAFGEGEHQVSFAEITQRCKTEFPTMFSGSVYYHPTSSAWVEPLQSQLNAILEIEKKPC